ncbi:MAG TPA: hypothetical protein VG759_08965 [Candidatus Angelobacter sp.]|jgi:hypothetical protein|nr:hypothetical protein [Candidatus Angelobacter sp.]
MKRFSTARAFFLALCAIGLCGCHKVKPVVLLPQQPPPATHTEPSPDQSQPATNTPADVQDQQPATNKPNDQSTTANTQPPKPEKTKPRHHPATVQRNNPQPVNATNGNGKAPGEVAKNNPPPKTSVPENNSSGQISPGISHDDAVHGSASTDQLLESTDTNLRNITKRQLSTDEQSIVAQINDYITQSRQAVKDGDLVRAHNLALKAHLLSDDLAKPR